MLAIALALVVPGSLFGWLLVTGEARHIEADFDAALARNTELFSLAAAEPLWNVDKDAVEALAGAMLKDPRVVSLRVSDASLGEFVRKTQAATRQRQMHRQSAPVLRTGKVIGEVEIVMDDGIDHLRVAELRDWLIVALAAEMLLAIVLIGVVLKQRVGRPLRALERFADRLAEGQLDAPLPPPRADELGRLQGHLDVMRRGWQRAQAARDEALGEVSGLLTEKEAILDNVVVGVSFIEQRTFRSANARLEAMLGYEADELNGKSAAIMYPSAEYFADLGARCYPALGQGLTYTEDLQLVRKDGSRFWARLSGHALDPAHPNDGSVWLVEDIDRRKAAEQQLKLAGMVFESSAEGILVTDGDARIVSVNPAFEHITGYPASEVIGKRPSLMQSGRHNVAFYKAMWAAVRERGQWAGEIWNRRKDGTIYPEWLTISEARDDEGRVSNYVGVFTDITAVKQSEERLKHMAHHDALTGLANRILLDDRLSHAMRKARRDERLLAVLFVDLDRFKAINDSLGHDVGDEMLVEVANRLESTLRAGDTLARLGGDEFVLLLDELDTPDVAGRVAQKLGELLTEAVHVRGHELYVSGSIGISIFPNDGEDISTLLKSADAAMYEAKAAGRNGYRFYAPAMTESALERMKIDQQLRLALEAGQFVLHYQPQFELDGGALVGAEALVRWQHPTLGMVPPDRFIPAAEESGLILPLGEWVMREACAQLVRWRAAGLDLPKVAVNVSVRQVERGQMAELTQAVLTDCGLSADSLEVEVTESVAAQGESLIDELQRIHALGVTVAIDDFGTGYSSLAYLGKLPIDVLKIDRAFVCDVETNPVNLSIIRAVLELARGLRVAVLAEGVETASQRDLLQHYGCPYAQGFHYSRPLPADEFLTVYGPGSG
jgi:diguanylate cyclase (GGDEF)-like protein/PAS domain S-box-containing protein